ncbi:hypothetical protein [Clostridium paridis]|uniref:DUF2933 domain-containing protein n=1 Tax=Clostridium paridis TaxID=2803863 RepID=A0A937FHF9_9CLOT|nr:hypothetical protein [Clostridium paridis]MBL4933819.1 hypothetical protein [Clostridium paridis]
MNCHNDGKEKHSGHNHNPLKHMLHMVLCCGLPIIVILSLPLITKFSPSEGLFLSGIVPFLCPIMMIFMIPMMIGGNKKNCCDSKKKTDVNSEVTEFNEL